MLTNLKVSKHIEEFTRFYNDSAKQFKYCYDMVNSCDKLTQDLLHKLELDNVSSEEKNKIATQLKYCRKDRRYYKDRVEELEPFVKLFSDANNGIARKNAVNAITNCLGAVRKCEEYHRVRTYKPRILKDTYIEE